jgi:uncharacterized protein (TIGR02391 family)
MSSAEQHRSDVSDVEVTSREVLQSVCADFLRTGTWPKYLDYEIRYRKIGPLEFLLQPLIPEQLRVYGDNAQAHLRIVSLDVYETCSGTSDDIARFVETARLFATKYINRMHEDPAITGLELCSHFNLDEAGAIRLCRIIDDFGGVLERGGGRGDSIEGWYFSIDHNAIYFEDISTLADFQRQKALVNELDQLRLRRSKIWRYSPLPTSEQVNTDSIKVTNFPTAEWTLHPAVAQAAASLFTSAHYSQAVRAAMQRFEVYLQDRLQDFDTSGWKVVAKALGGNRPELCLNNRSTAQERDEQEGIFHLAGGAMLAFRNFHSHGPSVELPAEIAIEQLALVSMLFRRLDTVTKPSQVGSAD